MEVGQLGTPESIVFLVDADNEVNSEAVKGYTRLDVLKHAIQVSLRCGYANMHSGSRDTPRHRSCVILICV